MRQLVELKKNAGKFASKNVEVIAVFREESEGEAGLQKIKDNTKVDFTLALDTGAKQTAKYSPGKMEFTSYVINSQGTIVGTIEGDLRNRAKSKQLLKLVDQASQSTPEPADDVDDQTAVRRAVLDYVEGVYEVKPEYIERSVHPNLQKFGYSRAKDSTDYREGTGMSFERLKQVAATYNKSGWVPADAPKEVVVLDVMNKTAAAKLTAQWGIDYFRLVKENGQWRILQVVWQSLPKK